MIRGNSAVMRLILKVLNSMDGDTVFARELFLYGTLGRKAE